MTHRPLTNRRRGFLLQEAAMAILIVTAIVGGASVLLQVVATQRRTEEFRAVAALEAANVMEDLLSRKWEELTATAAPQVKLSNYCQSRLPAPTLRIDIASEEGDAKARRIRVEVAWQNANGQRGQPTHLVAWRYQPAEAKP